MKEDHKKECEKVVVCCSSFLHKGSMHQANFDKAAKKHYFEITKDTPEDLAKVIRRFARK